MWNGLTYKRTRLAPTPSGYLHLGNLASFILTCRLARLCGASILLRIDDLDQSRVRDEFLQDIFETLQFMELPWDEGPRSMKEFKAMYSQINRRILYRSALDHLAIQGSVFGCDCSRSQLQQISDQEAYPGVCIKRNIPLEQNGISWRLHTDENIPFMLHEFGGTTHQVQLPEGKKYFQVRKKDGDATYQLSSVVDDIHFEIDLIVRGNDLMNSSLAQLFLSNLLPSNTFDQVRFLHHPLLADKDGRKFSKTAGDIAVKTLRERGNSPEEILSQIGKRLGTDQPFQNWQELGDWMLTYWT